MNWETWVASNIQVHGEQPVGSTRNGVEFHGQGANGTTALTIAIEGISLDGIENILENKTHRIVPVIASDQIPDSALSSTPKIAPRAENTGEPD